MSVRERLTAVPLQRFIILKTALCCSTGGYFFMFFMTSHNATNKIINITVSVISTTPFKGSQNNRRRSLTILL